MIMPLPQLDFFNDNPNIFNMHQCIFFSPYPVVSSPLPTMNPICVEALESSESDESDESNESNESSEENVYGK